MPRRSSCPQPTLTCPTCPGTDVPLGIVEACQRLLEEGGPCVGLASFECPALYFASLATLAGLEDPDRPAGAAET